MPPKPKTDAKTEAAAPGVYTDPNRKCSTVIDKRTNTLCDQYPGNHEWSEPEREDKESDEKYQSRRDEAQKTRGKVHAPTQYTDSNGKPALAWCQQYTDDPDRESE